MGRGLGQEDGMFFRCNTEFVVESMMPDFLHIVPVGDDTMFNGVFKGQDTSLGLSLISYIGIFLSHTDHDTLVAGSFNNGREDSPWGVISCKPSFTHTRTIINNQCGNLVVTHCNLFLFRACL